jgi:hypothetical protein
MLQFIDQIWRCTKYAGGLKPRDEKDKDEEQDDYDDDDADNTGTFCSNLWAALPSEIVDSFETWKADPSAFLRSDSSQVPTTLMEQYDYALSVRASAASSKILWRFITTAYYKTFSTRSLLDRYSIIKEAIAFVVNIIYKSPSYNRQGVEEQIISWAKEGRNNQALPDRLGYLSYFFFFPNLSEWL